MSERLLDPNWFSRPDHKGKSTVRVSHNEHSVVIDFFQPITWFGIDADQAEELADCIVKHARMLRIDMKR